MKPRMWIVWRLVWAPLARRKTHALLSLGALALGAALVTALLTVYSGVEGNLSAQFRRYGANLVATPRQGATLPLAAGEAARAAFPASAGVLYDVAQAEGPAGTSSVVVAGADLARLRALNTEWKVSGPEPAAGSCWLGVNAARLLGKRAGDTLGLAIGGRSASWRVAGTVESGTSEDNQVLAPYAQVAALAGQSGYTTLEIRVPGGAAAMRAAVGRLQAALPGAALQPVRQIARGEGAILLSTRAMMVATSGLILFTVLLCVTAALTTLALERRRDFGLMKALGGSELAVVGAFAGEAALLGLGAAVAGAALGALVAGGMGRALFGLWLVPGAAPLAAAVVLTVGVATLAALLPWPIIHAATPAAILRGE